MNEIFEKIYNDNNTDLNESSALFEKVYTEAEMLNEMNPKLRALLAAGLIGTTGLGAASCSMPTDDPYDVQYTIEQPTPENPEEIEEIEDSENPVTFETLGVQPKYFASLAKTVKRDTVIDFWDLDKYTDLILNKNGFVPIKYDKYNKYNDGNAYTRYIDPDNKIIFYIPISVESDLDQAIATYKAAHAE